jgi:hypothetical protein
MSGKWCSPKVGATLPVGLRWLGGEEDTWTTEARPAAKRLGSATWRPSGARSRCARTDTSPSCRAHPLLGESAQQLERIAREEWVPTERELAELQEGDKVWWKHIDGPTEEDRGAKAERVLSRWLIERQTSRPLPLASKPPSALSRSS